MGINFICLVFLKNFSVKSHHASKHPPNLITPQYLHCCHLCSSHHYFSPEMVQQTFYCPVYPISSFPLQIILKHINNFDIVPHMSSHLIREWQGDKTKEKGPQFARLRRGYRGERDKDGHPWEGQLFDHWGGNGVDQAKIRVRGGYILKVESKQFGT